MPKKEPLYPHVPKGKMPGNIEVPNKLNKVVQEIEETIRRQGRLHLIDIGKISQRENVSPQEVVERLPADITLEEETGYFRGPSTPVYYGILGFPLWIRLSERYGPDASNSVTIKADELMGAAKECKLTGPNGVFDHYNDLRGIVDELEDEVPSTGDTMVPVELYEVVVEKIAAALQTECNCRVF